MDESGNWDQHIRSYLSYLRFEKNLADNTVESYSRDISQFRRFLADNRQGLEGPEKVCREDIEFYLASLFDRNVRPATQSRKLSGIKSFFSFLVLSDVLASSPAEFVDMPRSHRKLPEVLTVEEVDRILAAIDLGHPQGHRNKAMIETLYSCGLRVSELISLRLGDLFFDDGFIRVTGKGSKQRLVPMSDAARRNISLWLDQRRSMRPDQKSEEIVFLNRRGRKLTRVMVFTIIRRAAERAGVGKAISPHTFRHSFATHLLQGRASIRQVQDLLGHESIITTEIYTHLDREGLRQSVETYHPLGEK
ncbi:MAG: site-specific tyrosine recombinase XerD [Alistipes sp.]|nr:site-specific tyrosine recombinase XerD [Alistipes sp.]